MNRTVFVLALLGVSSQAVHAHRAGELKPALIAPGGLPAFFNSQGPLAYTSLTRSEIPKDAVPMGPIVGHSCQFSLAIPLSLAVRSSSIFLGAVGNGGFAKILPQIEHRYPGLRGIYDVKVDLHVLTILGIFGRLCTEITAEGYR